MSAALALLAGGTPYAHAAWSPDPSINAPMAAVGGDQIVPRSCDDDAGGSIVVWADERGTNRDVYAVRFDRNGNVAPGWAADGIPICDFPGDQDNPVIVADGSGGAFIAWSDARSGNRDIHALRIRANGSRAPGWPNGGEPICTAPGDQGPVWLMEDGVGGVFIVWRDARAGNFDLYGQRMRDNGSVQSGWPNGGLALCTDPARQDLPTLAPDGSNGLFVAWQDERGIDTDIYAIRVRDNGRIVGDWPANGKPLCAVPGHQFAPVAVHDDQRGMFVFWEDFRDSVTSNLYGIRVQQNGALRNGWAAGGSVVCDAAGDQFTPQAIRDGWGNAIVAWEDYRNGIDNPDIYVLKVSANGAPDGSWPANGIAVCAAPGYQFEPQLASDGDHGAIVTWEDYRSGLENADVYAKRVGWMGVWPDYWVADGTPVSIASGHQQFPSLSGTGDVIIAWEDTRNGTSDIYAQRLEVQGTLANNAPAVSAAPGPTDPPPGFVQLSWAAPPLDAPHAAPLRIGSYRVWRDAAAFPPLPDPTSPGGRAAMPTGLQPRMTSPDEPAASDGHDWRVIDTLPATGSSLYTVLVPLPGGDGTPGYGLFRVESISGGDETSWMSDPFEAWSAATLDVASPSTPPALSVRPNPTRGTARIGFTLEHPAPVAVAIFATDGRRVRTLADSRLEPGTHLLRWDRRDAAGRRVPAGVYFARFDAPGEQRAIRFVVLD